MGSNTRKVYGYTPEPHQRAVHTLLNNARGSGIKVIVKSKRQVGKSLMIENELLRYAINYERTNNYCVSPTLTQARKIFKELVDATEGSGIVKYANATILEIVFINKSTISFRSAEQGDNLRGYTCNGITCIDEGAYIPDSVYLTIFPWCDARKSPMLICSSPRVKQGMFFDLFEKGLRGEDNTVSVDWNDYDLTKFLSPERLEEYRKLYPRNQFLTEYLGEFADGDGMVFEGIKDCVGKPSGYKDLFVGIDWGTGKGEDYTAVTIFNEKGEMVFIDYFNDLGTYPQVEKVIKDLVPYKDAIRLILAEDNSIGTPMIELLKTTLKSKGLAQLRNKVENFTTTNKSKATLVSQVQVGLEQKAIKLLDNNVLLNELGAYEATYNAQTGNITYNGAAGTHDDLVVSTLLAWDGYKKNNIRGNYIVR